MARVLVTGFITIDFIATVEGFATDVVPIQASELAVACGGRAGNQVMALAAIEAEAALLGRVGNDEHATVLTEELLELGVGVDLLQQAPEVTGMRLVAETADGRRAMTVYRGANDYLAADDLNRRADAIREAAAFGVTTEPAAAVSLRALEIAASGGVPTVLTHNPTMKPVSEALIAAADVIVCSDTGSSGLIDPGIAQAQPAAAIRTLIQRGAKSAVLLSAKRAVYATADSVREVSSPGRLDTEDATDAFVAGLLHGLACKDPVELAVLRGIRTSCLLVD